MSILQGRTLAVSTPPHPEARACFCTGPQPGETKCPCALAAESAEQRELRRLRAENAAMRKELGR